MNRTESTPAMSYGGSSYNRQESLMSQGSSGGGVAGLRMDRSSSSPSANPHATTPNSYVSPTNHTIRPRMRRRRGSARLDANGLDNSDHSCKSLDLDLDTSSSMYHRSSYGSHNNNSAQVVTTPGGSRWDENRASMSTPLQTRPLLRSSRSTASCTGTPSQQHQTIRSTVVRSLRSRRKSPHALLGRRPYLKDITATHSNNHHQQPHASTHNMEQGNAFGSFLDNPPLYSKDSGSEDSASGNHHHHKTQITYAMDESEASHQHQAYHNSNNNPHRRFSYYNNMYFLSSLMRLELAPEQLITLMLLFMIVCFLAGSHQLAMSATNQIEEITLSENKLLTHLRNVEGHSLQFADTLRQLQEIQDGVTPLQNGQQAQQQPDVNADILQHQIQQLREVEARLLHEVGGLEDHVLAESKNALMERYGGGDITVFMELELVGGANGQTQHHSLAIQLWREAPCTSWTFLQQVLNGVWDGATFTQQGRTLLAQPAMVAGDDNSASPQQQRKAIEPPISVKENISQQAHKRFSATLTKDGLAFNMQDNTRHFMPKDEAVSIGVVPTDNFVVLRNIVRDAGTGTIQITKVSATGRGF